MIITALEAHLREIKELWMEAFGGDSIYADMFLRRRAEEKNTLLYLQGETLCAMLFILPCRLVFGSTSYSCAYLYAVATGREYRGRGFSTALLDAAYKLCSERGYDVCALSPAEEGLFGFYEKRGYATQGYVKNLYISGKQLAVTSSVPLLSPVSGRELITLRKEAFSTAYLEWDSRAMDYIVAENEFSGGRFYRYSLGGERGFLSCTPTKQQLLIKEFSGNVLSIPQIVNGLHEIYHRDEYLFRLSNTAAAGELTPFAMTRWITDGTGEPFYLSHTLE